MVACISVLSACGGGVGETTPTTPPGIGSTMLRKGAINVAHCAGCFGLEHAAQCRLVIASYKLGFKT